MIRKIDNNLLEHIRFENRRREKDLSKFATKSLDGIRRQPESEDIRSTFNHDSDRIIHSPAYTRYIDKTQVFYLFKNDHITHRVLHVQLVSKIGRHIGRVLGLNEDLIEAIALGHDVGHAPYGHEGESYLSEICKKHDIGAFHHNVQSVQFLGKIDELNLTLQTLDGILCHDGESYDRSLVPNRNKSWNVFDREIKDKAYNNTELRPMTLEGCLVRIADVISFIGRDIEDAISVGLITRDQVPAICTEVLGNNNREIINTLVIDVIENSYGQDCISFSREVWEALKVLRDFNLNSIYENPRVKTQSEKIKRMFEFMFERFLDDMEKQNVESNIFKHHVKYYKNTGYDKNYSEPEIVRDYIAGMTDRYFESTFTDMFLPQKCRYTLDECEKSTLSPRR